MGDYGVRFSAAVAAELRAQRARACVSYDALAATTGLAKSTVLNYLKGYRDIPMTAFADLCRALEISQSEVFEAAERALEKG